ncbi:MAG: XylR N-terminal domain-containing protein [Clostridia bacterium]|nr:XylR N-terminal domain-containing protein [Clostridia bacterium]
MVQEELLSFPGMFKFEPETGVITFRGNRMLVFQADALGQLREELILTLGEDIARGVLLRFGYRCGYADVTSMRTLFDGSTDADLMLAGPKLHTYQGLVHVINEELKFDRGKGHFFMKGLWQNSFEAQQHLKLFGPTKEGVCWILTGYASGYASGFMGRDAVCVETKCVAMGDPNCAYEIRNVENWGQLADKEKECFKPSLTAKSLQKVLEEEREQIEQWRALNEATVILNSQLDTVNLPQKFIDSAKRLVGAEEALLTLKNDKSNGLIIYKDIVGQEELVREIADRPRGAIEIIFQRGTVINRDQSHFSAEELYGFTNIKKNLLGVPLFANGRVIGALLMANKRGDGAFDENDQELLTILGSQMGIALENSRLYEQVDEKLKDKADELERVNNILSEQHKILQKSLEIHKQLTDLALSGQGIEAICSTLAEITGNPIQVEDHGGRLIATSLSVDDNWVLGTKKILEQKTYAQQAKVLLDEKKPVEIQIGKSHKQYIVPVVAGKQVLGFIITALVDKKKLRRLDQVAMEHGATVIALEMLRLKASFEYSQRVKENFVEELLLGNLESLELARHHPGQMGFDLQNLFQVMLVEVDPGLKDTNKQNIYRHLRELVNNLDVNYVVISKNNQLIILVIQEEKCKECNEAAKLAEILKSELLKFINEGRWWIALGLAYDKIEEVNQAYLKAINTLEIMKALRQDNMINDFESLGVFSLLEINPKRFIQFVNRVLGPLLEYEQKHRAQLIDTLCLYYDNNSNILKAARSGYLNSSTLKYRLRRIQEITELDLKDPEVSLQVQLALKLIKGKH